jgi:molecular chaperone DnaK (HSP70)
VSERPAALRRRAPAAVGALCLFLASACKREARTAFLPEAIAVEQPGGSSSELFDEGSEIPVSATESFTTAKDGERRIVIHVLRGGGKTAGNLRNDAWYAVDGVAEAPAGAPRVLVTFELDAQGQLALSAREDERRLTVRKVDKQDRVSPLTEPDDDDDSDDDAQ